MQASAKLNHLRISPRKVRLVADLIRGLTVNEAEKQLTFLTKRAALPLLKLLNSAVANAQNNAKLVKDNLYISKILVNAGPTLKRWRPRAMGRAAEIMKRTSHVVLVLDEIKPGLRQEQKKEKIEQKATTPSDKQDKDVKEPEIKKYSVRDEQAKQKGFGRQTFNKATKMFRRKSI